MGNQSSKSSRSIAKQADKDAREMVQPCARASAARASASAQDSIDMIVSVPHAKDKVLKELRNKLEEAMLKTHELELIYQPLMEGQLCSASKSLQGTLGFRKDEEVQKRPDIKQVAASESARSSVEYFFQRQNPEHIKVLFDDHQDKTVQGLSFTGFRAAFNDLGLKYREEELKTMFSMFDTDNNGVIDLDEFKRAISGSPTEIERWAKTLNLSGLLASALSASIPTANDPLRDLANVFRNEADLDAAMEASFEGMRRHIREQISRLQKCFEQMALVQSNDGSSKFQTFAMACGERKDFYVGLQGRIGAPNPNLLKGMELEHCVMTGCDTEFTTSNYKITTTPSNEFQYVLDADFINDRLQKGFKFQKAQPKECPEACMFDLHNRRVRKIQRIGALKLLKLAVDAGLRDEEILSLLLYTGPMFEVYNMILRRFPANTFKTFEQGNNLFPTTIHVLVSAVMKVSRATKLPPGLELYRGLGGLMELPPSFSTADEQGCFGFMEWGFMSTTSNKATAVEYSGAVQGKPLPIIFKVAIGSIDRAACIEAFSQYPGEREYLWVPCSFLQPTGVRALELVVEDGKAKGAVTVLSVRVNASMVASTVDELEGKKKTMHLNAFRFLLEELYRGLDETASSDSVRQKAANDPFKKFHWASSVEDLLRAIRRECEEFLRAHEVRKPADFLEDDIYRGLVTEMLKVKLMARSKLARYVEDSSFGLHPNIVSTPLRDSFREYIRFKRCWVETLSDDAKREAALNLCKLLMLVKERADEVNEIGEAVIISAVADGLNASDMRLLMFANADVNTPNKDKQTPLMLAAKRGDKAAVEVLVTAKAMVNARDKEERTALHFVAHEGNVEVMRLLLDAKADTSNIMKIAEEKGNKPCSDVLKAAGAEGWTGLMVAAENGDGNAVERLLSDGSDVNAMNESGQTAWDLAVDEQCKQKLKAAGGGPGWGPLVDAVERGDCNAITELLAQGASVTGELAHYLPPLAARKGHPDALRLLLDAKGDVNAKQMDGSTMLVYAAEQGMTKEMSVLIEAKCDVNAPVKQWNGSTVLHRVAATGNLEAIRLILDAKGSVDVLNKKGCTPLACAAMHEADADAVRLLLQANANCNIADKDGRTSLHEAAEVGNTAAFQLLTAAKADINAVDKKGKTALAYSRNKATREALVAAAATSGQMQGSKSPHDTKTALLQAAKRGDKAAVDALVAAEGDINARDKKHSTALHSVAADGDWEAVRLLLACKADVDVLDKEKRSPLLLAAEKGDKASVQELIVGKANLNVRDKDMRGTALHYVAKGGHSDALCLILEAKADVNARDDLKETPLLNAVAKGDKACVDALLTATADINVRGLHGYRVLHYAAGNGHVEVMNHLISAKADIHALDKRKKTPLFFAAKKGHKASVEALIAAQADISARDKKYSTVLHHAALAGRVDAAQALIAAKADVGAFDKNCRAVLHYASAGGNVAVIQLLVDAKADVNAIDKSRKSAVSFAKNKASRETLIAAGALEVTEQGARAATLSSSEEDVYDQYDSEEGDDEEEVKDDEDEELDDMEEEEDEEDDDDDD